MYARIEDMNEYIFGYGDSFRKNDLQYAQACHKISNLTGRHVQCPEFSMKEFEGVNEIWRVYSMTNEKTNFQIKKYGKYRILS